MNFNEMPIENFNENPFKMIGTDWMLVAAGDMEEYNMLTASWGGMGVLWNMNVAHVYIRPTRYTYNFMEASNLFTMSFFDEEYRDALTLCGTKSGRDINKAKQAKLTPYNAGATVGFEEARMIMVCRKLYSQDIDPDLFEDNELHDFYPKSDYHRMYVGEIIRVLSK